MSDKTSAETALTERSRPRSSFVGCANPAIQTIHFSAVVTALYFEDGSSVFITAKDGKLGYRTQPLGEDYYNVEVTP